MTYPFYNGKVRKVFVIYGHGVEAMNQGLAIRFLAGLIIFLSTSSTSILAHGGEDHGGETPQSAVNTKGTITQTTRLEDIELTFKHPEIVPDTPTSGKLFLTQFQTNAPVDGASVSVAFEAAGGAVTNAVVEKADEPGSFTVKVPSLPQNSYVVRVGITTKGKTDTATISGVSVTPAQAGVTGSLYSWVRTLLTSMVFLFLAALFGTLIYLILRTTGRREIDTEAISA